MDTQNPVCVNLCLFIRQMAPLSRGYCELPWLIVKRVFVNQADPARQLLGGLPGRSNCRPLARSSSPFPFETRTTRSNGRGCPLTADPFAGLRVSTAADLTAFGIFKKTRKKKPLKCFKIAAPKNTHTHKKTSRAVILPMETDGIDRLPCGSVNRSSPLHLYSYLQRRLSNFSFFFKFA